MLTLSGLAYLFLAPSVAAVVVVLAVVVSYRQVAPAYQNRAARPGWWRPRR